MGMNRKNRTRRKISYCVCCHSDHNGSSYIFCRKVCLSFVKGVHRICVETKYGSGFRKRRTERNDRMDV